jgi:MarR family transcriptional regulator for hemolysin
MKDADIDRFQLLLRELPRVWRTCVDRELNPLGLSQAKWRVVYFVGRAKRPLTQSDIAELLGIEAPTVVRLLDRLAEDGWLERRPCATDRRVRHVHLTPKAVQVYHRIDEASHKARRQIMGPITEAELQLCSDILQRMVDAGRQDVAPVAGESRHG